MHARPILILALVLASVPAFADVEAPCAAASPAFTRVFPDLHSAPRPAGVGVVDNMEFEGPVATALAPDDAARPAGLSDDDDGVVSDTPAGWVDISPVVAEVRQEFADRMAGLYVEPGNETHVFVRLAGEAPVANRAYGVGDTCVEVTFLTGQPHTLAELQHVLSTRWDEIAELLPSAHAHYASELTGALVISVDPDDTAALENAVALERLLGVPVEVRPEPRAVLQIAPG